MSYGIIPLSGVGRVALEIGDIWGGKVPMYICSIYIEKNSVTVINDSKYGDKRYQSFCLIHSTNCLLIIINLTFKSSLKWYIKLWFVKSFGDLESRVEYQHLRKNK